MNTVGYLQWIHDTDSVGWKKMSATMPIGDWPPRYWHWPPWYGGYYTPDFQMPYIGSRPQQTPHVCPLCSGNGGTKCNEDGTFIRDCFPCNGSGIVWSPVTTGG